MSPLEFSLVFSLGLVSSLHCLQMCGPLVLSWSVSLPRGAALGAHLRYNAGRILTYMMLGATAGALGKGIGAVGRLAGWASGARIVAGAAMILSGILMIGLFRSNGLITLKQPARLSRWLGRNLLGPARKFQLGLMLGFLPCGLIYAALLKAMDTGSPVGGALTMLAFGSGTAAALLSLGLASSFAGFRLARWSTKVAAICIMASGAVLLYRGLTAPKCHVAEGGVVSAAYAICSPLRVLGRALPAFVGQEAYTTGSSPGPASPLLNFRNRMGGFYRGARWYE